MFYHRAHGEATDRAKSPFPLRLLISLCGFKTNLKTYNMITPEKLKETLAEETGHPDFDETFRLVREKTFEVVNLINDRL